MCVFPVHTSFCTTERGVAEAIREDILEQVFQIFKNHHDDAELVEACTSLVWNLSETGWSFIVVEPVERMIGSVWFPLP